MGSDDVMAVVTKEVVWASVVSLRLHGHGRCTGLWCCTHNSGVRRTARCVSVEFQQDEPNKK